MKILTAIALIALIAPAFALSQEQINTINTISQQLNISNETLISIFTDIEKNISSISQNVSETKKTIESLNATTLERINQTLESINSLMTLSDSVDDRFEKVNNEIKSLKNMTNSTVKRNELYEQMSYLRNEVEQNINYNWYATVLIPLTCLGLIYFLSKKQIIISPSIREIESKKVSIKEAKDEEEYKKNIENIWTLKAKILNMKASDEIKRKLNNLVNQQVIYDDETLKKAYEGIKAEMALEGKHEKENDNLPKRRRKKK